jgi:hypothetical protein
MVDSINTPSGSGILSVIDSGTLTIPGATAGNTSSNTVTTGVTDPTTGVIMQANPQAGELDSGALFNLNGNAINDGQIGVLLPKYDESAGAWIIEGVLKGHSECVVDWVLLA